MSELKACPFCGGQPIFTEGGTITSVRCEECGYLFDYASLRGDFGWVDDWNTRPIEDAIQRKLDIAVKALEEISNSTNEAYLTGGRKMKRIARQAIAEIQKEGDE